MKILQVISVGNIAGGAEKSVALLKQGLKDRGHEVLVLASDHKKGGQQFSDIEYKEIDSEKRTIPSKLIYHLWYPASYKTLRKAIKDFKPDIVHFHTMGQLSPSAVFALGNTPAVLTVHGPEEYTRNLLEWYFSSSLFHEGKVDSKNYTFIGKLYFYYYAFLQRRIYGHAFRKHLNFLIAPSKYMEKVLIEEGFGVPIRQIYNGINLPQKVKPNTKYKILFVGRLEHVKGVHNLLEAFVIVKKSLPQAALEIVGDGSKARQLQEYAQENNLDKSITFNGWLNNENVLKKYEEAMIVVVPSIWPENLPTVCIEALAVGRPVVGTNTGGIPELITDGITGGIVEPGNVEALADKIIDILSKDIVEISEAAARSAYRFDINNFLISIENLYKEALENENLSR